MVSSNRFFFRQTHFLPFSFHSSNQRVHVCVRVCVFECAMLITHARIRQFDPTDERVHVAIKHTQTAKVRIRVLRRRCVLLFACMLTIVRQIRFADLFLTTAEDNGKPTFLG